MSGIELIVQPDHGPEPMLALLRGAEREIVVKMFTFDHAALLDALIGQHGRGIAVRVLLNEAKATGERINDAAFAALDAAGVPVKWTSAKFIVTHEKSLVVDGARAMVSTFNFMEKYFTKTRDYGLFLSDPVQVEQVRACFEADWSDETFAPAPETGLAWSPGGARSILCGLIDSARETVEVQHPKFAEPVVFERLHAALGRGVKVRILCGGKHGLHQPDMMYSFALWRVMREGGAKVHKQRGLRTHGKLVIVDDARAYLGTQNLDQPAFDLRREVGVVVEDAGVLEGLVRTFRADWDASRKYEPPYPILPPDSAEDADFDSDADLQHG